MEHYKPIPISVAADILEKYLKDEVIIIAWDSRYHRVQITTDGSTEAHKENAAGGSVVLVEHLIKMGVISRESQIHEDPENRLRRIKKSSKP